jgi:hypothetical protein
MYSLTDYKNRVSAKGAVTDWLTSDSAIHHKTSYITAPEPAAQCERETAEVCQNRGFLYFESATTER